MSVDFFYDGIRFLILAYLFVLFFDFLLKKVRGWKQYKNK